MLELCFRYPKHLARLRRGALGPHIDEIAAYLLRTGYAPASAKRYLSLIGTFSTYAGQRFRGRRVQLGDGLVARFLRNVPRTHWMRTQAQTALGHVRRHLLARGQWQRPRLHRPTQSDRTLEAYDAYLRDVRGLQPRSREEYVRTARRFLAWYRRHRPGRGLGSLQGSDVLRFLGDVMPKGADGHLASSTRSLLRYVRWSGAVQADLTQYVYAAPRWRLATLPRRLSWAQVRRLIDSINAEEPAGRRDRAILLLLAHLGLRGAELRALTLSDVNWRRRELHLTRTKSRKERILPLPDEAAWAVSDYVQHGRRRCTLPTLFLTQRPPQRPMAHSSTLSAIIRRRLCRCGITMPPRVGAHMLRHSLATRLVERGAAIKEVADLLGHQSIDTTALYTKVDLPGLRRVVLPFPSDKV